MINLQSTFLNMQQFKLTTYDANALVDTGTTNSCICKNFENQQNINYKSIKFATNVANLSLKPKSVACYYLSLSFCLSSFGKNECFKNVKHSFVLIIVTFMCYKSVESFRSSEKPKIFVCFVVNSV